MFQHQAQNIHLLFHLAELRALLCHFQRVSSIDPESPSTLPDPVLSSFLCPRQGQAGIASGLYDLPGIVFQLGSASVGTGRAPNGGV
jgi:hypothetical protein